MNKAKLSAIKSAADNAVKQTAAEHCPVGKIAAGAVRGAIIAAREIGWDDAEGVAAAMSGVLQSSVELLQAIYNDERPLSDALSTVSQDAMRMALEINADTLAAAAGAVVGAMGAVRKTKAFTPPHGVAVVAGGLVKGAAAVGVETLGSVVAGVVQAVMADAVSNNVQQPILIRAAAKGVLAASATVGPDAEREAITALKNFLLDPSTNLH